MSPASGKVCDECERSGSDDNPIVFCSACNYNQCCECWESKIAHKKNKPGPGGLPHDKVNPRVVEDLKACLAAPATDAEEKEAHLEDEDTSWFGVTKDPDRGSYEFQDRGRYASIMARSMGMSNEKRFPKIVSFIGDTGAGKSSLIKLLIDLNDTAQSEEYHARPVVGKETKDQPTSADVHLYSDPATFLTSGPVLYADSEGMRGGERPPMATSAVHDAHNDKAVPGYKLLEVSKPSRRWVRNRLIEWLQSTGPEYEKQVRREFAVTEMYPRILYAFSDLIVFVLRNARVVESVAEQLLLWAHANSESSVNLPSHPHAIIVLNASASDVSQDEWDEEESTAQLLSSAISEIETNPTFKQYVEALRQQNHHVIDMRQLLGRYYSDVTVLRVPTKEHFELLDKQRRKLYSLITAKCAMSHKYKTHSKMLSDSDDLQIYLQSAFDHFSRSLEIPFDFVAASVRNRPIPKDLSDHILRVATAVARNTDKRMTTDVFKGLSEVVASCIQLDAARKKLLGSPMQWFDYNKIEASTPPRPSQSSSSLQRSDPPQYSYRQLCNQAIDVYQREQAPCEYTYKSTISRQVYTCVKTSRTHGEMHRLIRKSKISEDIPQGKYYTTYVKEQFRWDERILQRLKSTEPGIGMSKEDARAKVTRQHLARLRNFFSKTCLDTTIFHTTCLCCLHDPPEHKLSCGHLICTRCARDFGQVNDEHVLTIDICPLHESNDWNRPQQLTRLQPPSAGLRILSLDGGGMRGIVEILVLEKLEAELGGELRIQQFFDLIVGTSTGGIIALGLGAKEWSVSECKDKFIELAGKAFTKRTGQDYPGIKHWNLFRHQSRYRTETMEMALKGAFGEEQQLFGGHHELTKYGNKVAVTATTPTGDRAIILANYNRRNSHLNNYLFDRQDEPANELFLWEAARCTSAAPGYFKPFLADRREGRTREFIDGGLKLNNPSIAAYQEARSAFEDGSLKVIDVLMSIGTARNADEEEKLNTPHTGVRQLKFSRINNILKLVKHQIQVSLETERMWEDLVRDETIPTWQRQRFHRLNPDIGYGPPELDAMLEMPALMNNTSKLLNDKMREPIRLAARELAASCFYFQQSSYTWKGSEGLFKCEGKIRCRFPNWTETTPATEIRDLGTFINKYGAAPCFLISSDGSRDAEAMQQVDISCSDMITRGVFDPKKTCIATRGGDAQVSIFLSFLGKRAGDRFLPISGFPRALMQSSGKLRQ